MPLAVDRLDRDAGQPRLSVPRGELERETAAEAVPRPPARRQTAIWRAAAHRPPGVAPVDRQARQVERQVEPDHERPGPLGHGHKYLAHELCPREHHQRDAVIGEMDPALLTSREPLLGRVPERPVVLTGGPGGREALQHRHLGCGEGLAREPELAEALAARRVIACLRLPLPIQASDPKGQRLSGSSRVSVSQTIHQPGCSARVGRSDSRSSSTAGTAHARRARSSSSIPPGAGRALVPTTAA